MSADGQPLPLPPTQRASLSQMAPTRGLASPVDRATALRLLRLALSTLGKLFLVAWVTGVYVYDGRTWVSGVYANSMRTVFWC
jgi:hypothetical protein